MDIYIISNAHRLYHIQYYVYIISLNHSKLVFEHLPLSSWHFHRKRLAQRRCRRCRCWRCWRQRWCRGTRFATASGEEILKLRLGSSGKGAEWDIVLIYGYAQYIYIYKNINTIYANIIQIYMVL